MKFVPVERVDLMFPARTDGNGTTWYRPANGDGWTAIAEFAHPSYAGVRYTPTPSREETK